MADCGIHRDFDFSRRGKGEARYPGDSLVDQRTGSALFAIRNDYFLWRYFPDAPYIAFPQIALFLPQMMLGE